MHNSTQHHTNHLAKLLDDGLKELALSLQEHQKKQLLRYIELLVKWNRAYNLTSVRDPSDMISRHLLDSLVISPYLSGQHILDVGTGAGLPGIPLSILFPSRSFTLLDSNGKKTRFLMNVKLELGLSNVAIQNCRSESFQPDPLFDTVVSRAFASLENMLNWTAQMTGDSGVYLAMKGLYPEDEIQLMPNEFKVAESKVLNVPNSDAERHLIIIHKVRG